MALDRASHDRALELIRQLRDPALPDDSSDVLFVELERLLSCPRISDLLFHEIPELSDEEVTAKALEQKPFAL